MKELLLELGSSVLDIFKVSLMQEDIQTERGNSRVAAASPMFRQRLGSPLWPLIKAKESTLS